jgi:ubiquinone/menaquinone biosynthesis C-methylase UbiE
VFTQGNEFLHQVQDIRAYNYAVINKPIDKETVMPVSEQVKTDYDISAVTYNDYSLLPSGQLESQLIKVALGDCTGRTILDLGGGTGLHAREAIDLGADSVDIVDISPEMLKIGQEIEKSLGRENIIRFFEADVSKPLSHLPLREDAYDVISKGQLDFRLCRHHGSARKHVL